MGLLCSPSTKWVCFAPHRRIPLKLLHCWGLLDPCDTKMMCDLNRAEAVVRRHFSSLGVTAENMNHERTTRMLGLPRLIDLGAVYFGGQACHTLTSASSNLYWVVLPGGSRGCLSPIAVANFMGMGARPVSAARRVVKSDYVLSSFIADSEHLRMSAFVAHTAVTLSPCPLRTVGSLYSGAFDALSEGCVVSGQPLRRVFAAECDSRKKDVLRAAYPYHRLFDDVATVAASGLQVDVFVASPPCHEASRARRYESTVEADDISSAAVSSHLSVISNCVRAWAPRVFIIEQASGLLTHHRALFEEFDRDTVTKG